MPNDEVGRNIPRGTGGPVADVVAFEARVGAPRLDPQHDYYRYRGEALPLPY